MRKATAIRQSILPRADRTVPSHSYSMVVDAEAIRVDSEAWSDAILRYDYIFLAAPRCLAPATARARAARYSSIPAPTTMPWCLLRSPDAPQEFGAGAVPAIGAGGGRVFDTLRALAMELRAKRAYANTTTFDLSRKVSGIFSRLFIRESSSWQMDVVGTRCAGRDLRVRRTHVRTGRHWACQVWRIPISSIPTAYCTAPCTVATTVVLTPDVTL